ncbi:MAG TPA: xanthine dehydrogenase family protein molybdopterin-binding subunit [Actinomycetota bacterium]
MPSIPGPWIGRAERRREDLRLIQGDGRFVDNRSLPDMAHLAMVRSPLAHARVGAVDARVANTIPGVLAVLTAADLGAVHPMPVGRAEGSEVVSVAPPLLAGDRVRFVGEAVAAVVAVSRALAEDAAELVTVDYEPLEVVADVDAALSGAVAVHDEAPDNVLVRWSRTGGDVDGAFALAHRRIRERLFLPRLVAAPIETRGAIALYEQDEDLLTLWLSSQDPHRPLAHLSTVLGRSPERIRVIVEDVGGAFGSKGTLATEAAVAAIAAMRLGRPVKWIEDRSENFLAAYQGRGQRADAELAVDASGRFLGLRARVVADLGAYLFPTTPVVPVTSAMLMTGAYDIPAADVELLGVATNKVPTGPYRGAGRPEAAYVVERLADLAARELGLDPVEIRKRNFIPPERFPYATVLGYTYDSGDYARALDRACERLGHEPSRSHGVAGEGGPLVGTGLAVFVERAGAGLWETGGVEVLPGGAVVVRTGSTPHGQGHETTFAQIAADALGVDASVVRLEFGDTAVVPEGMGSYASRSVTVGGSAVLEATRAVRQKATRIAALLLEAEADAIRWEDGWARAGVQEVSLAEVAEAAADPSRLKPDEAPGLSAQTRFQLSGPVFPFGAYVVAVRIDPDTGLLGVDRVVAVDDAGRIVNPLLAEGQVIGSTVQGFGEAVLEEMVHTEDGQVLTGTFVGYGIASAMEAPPIESEFLETLSPFNPLGAKGIGESGSIAMPAAVANAVADALAPLGIRHLDPPYTPEKLWRAIRAARGTDRPA